MVMQSQVHARPSLAGAKLEDSEVRSVASNQSEMEFSSLQDMVRPMFCPSGLCDSDTQKGPEPSLGAILLPNDFYCLLTHQTCGSWLIE